MDDKCPCCGKDLECLGGCSAHRSNWYCSDEKGCGYQAWNPKTHSPATHHQEPNDGDED